jgi:hypothetical protein
MPKRAPTPRSLPTIENKRKVILMHIFLIFLLFETHLKCRHIVGITYRRLRTDGFAQRTTPCSHDTRALHRDPATTDGAIPQLRLPLVMTLHTLMMIGTRLDAASLKHDACPVTAATTLIAARTHELPLAATSR